MCYPDRVRPALRRAAVLAVAIGMAIVAPVQRFERSTDERAGIASAGERGQAPAIRTGADLGRRLAHPAPLAPPPAVAAVGAPPLAGIVRSARGALRIGRARAGARRARAPPPSA